MKTFTMALAFLLVFLNAGAQKIDVYARPVKQERDRDFDALHYKIELEVDLGGKRLTGQNTISLIPLRNDLSLISIDAVSLVVTDVFDQTGVPLTYDQTDDKLNIKLLRSYSYKDTLKLEIRYYLDKPVLGLRFIEPSPTNPRQVSSDCFPNKARQWIPCYDYPNDKVTTEMIVTVDTLYKVLSNGKLCGVTKKASEGKNTWHWNQDKPLATYLINLSIADYAVIKDSLGTLPVDYWVYHWNVDDAKLSFSKTPSMIAFYNHLYHYTFPWAKYDQVISTYMGGGAEATSATLLGEGAVTDERAALDFSYEGVIAHEIAHQWWGDLITLRSWEHTWMNESFATYSDYLYKRFAWGDDEAQYDLLMKKNAYLKEAHNKYMRPIVFNRYDDPGQNFDSHTYPKGACVLHMLRYILGDETFFRTLSTFLHQYAFQPVTTQDFMKCVKDVSGQNMDWFFEEFLFKPGHPVFEVSKAWDAGNGTMKIKIEQKQDQWNDVPVYKIPVNIGFYFTGKKQVEKIWLNDKTETFEFPLDSQPLMVRFDDGNNLLKEWTFNKPEKELIYQAFHDDVTGKLWALNELKKFSDSEQTINTWNDIAVNDKFWAVREAAINLLSEYHNPDFTDLFLKATSDENSKVRIAAVRAIGQTGDHSYVDKLKKIFESDKSYLVMAEALRSIGKCGGRSQLKYLQRAQSIKSARDVVGKAAKAAIEGF